MDSLLELVGVPAVIVIIVAVFWKADDALSDEVRSDLAKWIRSLNPPSANNPVVPSIYYMFKWVFGEKHLSKRCILVSFLYSTAILLILSATLAPILDTGICQPVGGDVVVEPNVCERDFVATPSYVQIKAPMTAFEFVMSAIHQWPFFLFAFLVNPISDYASLAVTRLHLKYAVSRITNLPLLVLSDFVISALVFLLILHLLYAIFIAIFSVFLGEITVSLIYEGVIQSVLTLIPDAINSEFGFFEFTSMDALVPGIAVSAMVGSIWIWVALFSTIMLRALSRTGPILAFLQYALNLDKKPLFSIGWVSAVILFLVYFGFFLIGWLSGG